MVAKKRGLGRGLDVLLGSDANVKAAPSGQRLEEVPVEWIKPGKYQPRKHMDEDSLDELAASIRAQGVMQPIVLRPVGEQRYEIIAGERRWRACQRAGLEKVPAVIRDVSDESAVAIALIENIQREDLNPMEQAVALQRLLDEFDMTHQQVAEAVGKSRVSVTNYLRLLNLGETVAAMLARGDIEMGHARALLGLTDDRQLEIARLIVDRSLSVRQTEVLVRRAVGGSAASKAAGSKPGDPDTRQLERRLSTHLGQPVAIQHTQKGKGKLVISYNSLDELDGILSRFGELD